VFEYIHTPNNVGLPPMSCRYQNKNVNISPIPNPINQDTNSTDIYLKVANIFITAIHFPDADSDINYLETKAAVQKQASEQEGSDCQISLDKRPDMVTDAVSKPPDNFEDEPFLGKWIAVIKMSERKAAMWLVNL
jgi:hypothetical protein